MCRKLSDSSSQASLLICERLVTGQALFQYSISNLVRSAWMYIHHPGVPLSPTTAGKIRFPRDSTGSIIPTERSDLVSVPNRLW